MLRFPRARHGARAYLAVEGGVVDAGRPGEPARRLEAGDVLAREDAPSPARRAVRGRPALQPPGELVLRVLPGPQREHFAAVALDRFVSEPWRVTPVSDRRGLRLEGKRLEHAGPVEIAPEGTVAGSVQVPGDGLPIVLGPDGPVTGGYPKIATVIESDLPLLGQAGPGAVLRFRMVSLEDAMRARREYD
jgi:allophanate hydrolase subunit 2